MMCMSEREVSKVTLDRHSAFISVQVPDPHSNFVWVWKGNTTPRLTILEIKLLRISGPRVHSGRNSHVRHRGEKIVFRCCMRQMLIDCCFFFFMLPVSRTVRHNWQNIQET
jgi:hypothetical protein